VGSCRCAAFWGSRNKRTKNNAPLVNGQVVEESEVFYYTILGGKKWAFSIDKQQEKRAKL
jgi:hypothetical protein